MKSFDGAKGKCFWGLGVLARRRFAPRPCVMCPESAGGAGERGEGHSGQLQRRERPVSGVESSEMRWRDGPLSLSTDRKGETARRRPRKPPQMRQIHVRGQESLFIYSLSASGKQRNRGFPPPPPTIHSTTLQSGHIPLVPQEAEQTRRVNIIVYNHTRSCK